MKFSLLVGLFLISSLTQAANLRCVQGKNVLVLENTRSRNFPFLAKMYAEKRSDSFFMAQCALVNKNVRFKGLECYVRTEYTDVPEIVAVVELANDGTAAEMALAKADRRGSSRYKTGKILSMRCSDTNDSVYPY